MSQPPYPRYSGNSGSPHSRQLPPSLARRLLPVLALGSVAGTLVFALDRPGAANAGSADGAASDTSASASVDSVDPGAASTVASSVPTTPRSTNLPSTAPSTHRTTSTTVRTTTAATTSSSTCKTYNGPTEYNDYGPVQVRAAVSKSGKICSVSVLRSPRGGTSTRINTRAVPILNKQAMSAQSARINGVSGATYTTNGYIDSLQAILDAATR